MCCHSAVWSVSISQFLFVRNFVPFWDNLSFPILLLLLTFDREANKVCNLCWYRMQHQVLCQKHCGIFARHMDPWWTVCCQLVRVACPCGAKTTASNSFHEGATTWFVLVTCFRCSFPCARSSCLRDNSTVSAMYLWLCSIYEPEGTATRKSCLLIGSGTLPTNGRREFSGYSSFWFVTRTRPISF